MNEQPIRVLYFVDRMLRGGIQSLVIDWVSRFNKDKIQVDFLLLDDGKKYELEETLKELGCVVYKLNGMWIRKPLDFIKYSKVLDDFFKEHHDYKVVHLHSSSKNYMVLKYAQKYNIPVRIAHSHNIDFQTKNLMKKVVGDALKIPLRKYSTDYFACSKIAGEWLFGKEIIEQDNFKVINNAVDYEKFKYNEETRKRIRKELQVDKEELLFGNVGRFENQKNHTFLIDIFNEVLKQNQKSKLLLIGTGSLEDSIKEKVKLLGIEEKVIFAGFKKNVNEYVQAMDALVMPSVAEGLGLALIEGQVSGLQCFASEGVVPVEAKVTNKLKFISLKQEAKTWASELLNADTRRRDYKEEIKKAGYFIDDVVEQLINIYSK